MNLDNASDVLMFRICDPKNKAATIFFSLKTSSSWFVLLSSRAYRYLSLLFLPILSFK